MMTRIAQDCRKFMHSKWFWLVLALKLVAGAVFTSHFVGDLFLPFVGYFVGSGFQNPWDEFLRRGVLDAFPYSSVMLLALSAPQALGHLLFGGDAPLWLRLLLFRIPLLAADAAIYLMLCRWFETKWKYVFILYWCSPVIFYINYVHGQVDAIPTLFLMMGLWSAIRQRPGLSGLCLGLGIAAKFNVAIAVPFLLWYLVRSGGNAAERWSRFWRFSAALAGAAGAFILPLLSSPGYRAIVFHSDRTNWVYDLFFSVTPEVRFFLAPGAAFILFSRFLAYRRFNRDLIVLYLGLILTTLVLLVPPAPGWYYWSIPFLTYFLVRQELATFAPFWTFNLFYLAYYLFFDPIFAPLQSFAFLPAEVLGRWRSLAFTLMQASLGLLDLWIYKIGVHSNDEYQARTAPVFIGIAGDSSSGKHTLSEVFLDLLDPQSSSRLYGDDYHRWPRGHEEWKRYTHLDPRGNFVDLPAEHLISLKKGHSISKPVYDHGTGQFSRAGIVDSTRFVVFLGLHPFLTRKMRSVFDLKIYMEPAETLRQEWKLARDQKERGYTRDQVLDEIKRRESDSLKYIHPQKKHADWIIAYLPDGDAPESSAPPLKVRHLISSEHTQLEALIEIVRRTCPSLEIQWDMDDDLEHQVIEVRGKIGADEVQTIAYRFFPNLEDFSRPEPVWRDGYQGLNQLILLSFLREIVRRSP